MDMPAFARARQNFMRRRAQATGAQAAGDFPQDIDVAGPAAATQERRRTVLTPSSAQRAVVVNQVWCVCVCVCERVCVVIVCLRQGASCCRLVLRQCLLSRHFNAFHLHAHTHTGSTRTWCAGLYVHP